MRTHFVLNAVVVLVGSQLWRSMGCFDLRLPGLLWRLCCGCVRGTVVDGLRFLGHVTELPLDKPACTHTSVSHAHHL